MASCAAYRASPCSGGTGNANFIAIQKVYCVWVPPGLIPQVNSFLSAVEYFIFPISESTDVKKERERNPISPAQVCETNNAASIGP